jgi:hypothetical protein
MQADGRLGQAPDAPLLKVHSVWDLGWNNAMAILLVQRSGSGEIRLIDFIEDSLRTLDSYVAEGDLLAAGLSIFRHNRYTMPPVWCYRRSRDRLPYGVIRRVRDMQQDLNKRASKALFLLNTNQVIADEGAVDDWDMLRDEADRPDGLIVKKAGRELDIRRDTDAATGQIEMMQLAAQSIQKSAGVGNENLGRQTNAISGEAIKARQLQGSVVTTEPFDNLRLATQNRGEKQLSLVEQFYTAARWRSLPRAADGGAQPREHRHAYGAGASNSLRVTPDRQMIDCGVPTRSSVCIGTALVTVVPGKCSA